MLEERFFNFIVKCNAMSDLDRKDLAKMLCKLVSNELDEKLEEYLFYTKKTVKRKLGVLEED